MKKIIIFNLVCLFVGFMGYNLYSDKRVASTPDLLLANVEALANDESWLEEWWESKVYACQAAEVWEYRCMLYKDLPEYDWEVSVGQFQPYDEVCGYFQEWDTECVSGTETAHCWDCE